LLCAVLAALLFFGTVRTTTTTSTPVTVSIPAVPATSNPALEQPKTPLPRVVTPAPTTTTTVRPANVSSAKTTVTAPAVPVEAPKTLPEMEKAYLSTTNRDTRLDLMMDIAEVPTADSVKSLTRLFESENDPDMKVDLIDSLLGIDGFKDEKLIMLTMAIRQGLPNDVRESAIDGLIDLEDARAIALLNGLLNDPDTQIRESAQDAIELLQTPRNQIPKLR